MSGTMPNGRPNRYQECQPFLKAIAADPDNPLPKLIYADRLEDWGIAPNLVRVWRNRALADETRQRWEYTGDVNLECGGTFINLENWGWGYVEFVEVTEVDFVRGLSGAVLIERGTVSVDSPERNRDALRCAGPGEGWGRGNDRRTNRLILAECLLHYGLGKEIDRSESVQLEEDGFVGRFDGWTVHKRLHNTTLEAYVKSQWLKD